MQRRTFLKSGGAFLLANAGCQSGGQIADNSPAAKTPVVVSFSAVVPSTCAWTVISPNIAGDFEVLPSGHPSGDFRVVLRAPYPSKIEIRLGPQLVLLREADNTQAPGEGYHKINSITLAPAGDTFEWDITVTPPLSEKLALLLSVGFTNVSLNPNFSGTDKTSVPLPLNLLHHSVADLQTWLNQHPNVRDAIIWEDPAGPLYHSQWTAQDKQRLRDAFSEAWNTRPTTLQDPVPNKATLLDDDEPLTVIAEGDAWPLYLAHIAYSLAAEIAGWTTWSITNYTSDQLALLFDSRQMFRWSNASNGYEIHEGNSPDGVVLASPWTTLKFLHESGIYTCRGRLDVIERALDWCRQNLQHFTGGFKARNMEDQWQYRGCPPVVRIIEGTTSPATSDPAVRHRTGGCWGTTAFLRAILRVLNIPVQHEDHAGHSMPYFVTEGLYLSHGDDPYNRHSHATPPFPARELLIDQATRDAWFGNGLSNTQILANVGRRPRDLAIKYISNEMLRNHCADVAAGKSHADSSVFDSLKGNYQLADLEAQNLWQRIDAKLTGLGGCGQIP